MIGRPYYDSFKMVSEEARVQLRPRDPHIRHELLEAFGC